MRELVIAAEAAVAQGNWHAALAIALTMPGICGRIENPSTSPKARFVQWYDRFLLKRNQAGIGATRIKNRANLEWPCLLDENPATGLGPRIIGLTDGQELAKRTRCAKD